MVNMGELFANPRLINVEMDRVALSTQERNSSLLAEGDLLFARQSLVLAGAGKCSIFVSDVEDVCFESHVIRCRLNQQLADPHFYFYFFSSFAGRRLIETIVEQGAGASGIRGSDLAELAVPWVDPAVQRRAAAVLRQMDDKIAVNRRINQTLESMAQAIFKSWFVDFDPVKAKIAAKAEGRDPLRAAMSAISGKLDPELDTMPPDQRAQLAATAALFSDELVELPSGNAPAGWSMKTFAQMTDKIGSGATPRGGKEVYQSEGVALIRSQNVYDSLFVWEGLARITDEAADQLRSVTVQAGDVLLNITGASILRTCVVLPDVLPARVNQHVAIIRATAGVPPRFLHHHLLRAETKNFLLGLNAGASREAITKGHIEALEVLVPSPELLASFKEITDPLFRQVECCAREMRTLAETRDALLPKMLSGELSIDSATAAVEGLGAN
jgi:type I restriction enzyme S subunit